MDREIKFRSWNPSNNKMYVSQRMTNTDHWVLLQYTGKKDKNGTDIYEGDIVQVTFGFTIGLKTNYIVVYDTGNCGFHMIHATGDGDKYGLYTRGLNNNNDVMEVIGNKFENPELLKK